MLSETEYIQEGKRTNIEEITVCKWVKQTKKGEVCKRADKSEKTFERCLK